MTKHNLGAIARALVAQPVTVKASDVRVAGAADQGPDQQAQDEEQPARHAGEQGQTQNPQQ